MTTKSKNTKKVYDPGLGYDEGPVPDPNNVPYDKRPTDEIIEKSYHDGYQAGKLDWQGHDRQMTLEEIGKNMEFMKRSAWMLGVGIIMIAILVLLK